ncbi:MAG: hypothetical protein HKM95_00015 [Inquilinus sp.]|nr:hypothetical protein [Inquilinus sp.]
MVVAVIGVLVMGLMIAKDVFQSPNMRDLLSVYLLIMAVLAGLCTLVFSIVALRIKRHPNEIVVTDRRVLLARGSRLNRLTTISTCNIATVGWSDETGWHYLEIGRGGDPFKLPAFDDQDTLGAAIAKAAGVDAPVAIGRFSTMDLSFAAGLIFFAGSLAAFGWGAVAIGMIDPKAISEFQTDLVLIGLLVPAGIVGWFLTRWFGALLTAMIMWPFVTADQMRAGLSLHVKEGWPLRLALRWAEVLYGQRLEQNTG